MSVYPLQRQPHELDVIIFGCGVSGYWKPMFQTWTAIRARIPVEQQAMRDPSAREPSWPDFHLIVIRRFAKRVRTQDPI